MNKIAKNLEAFNIGINNHDRANPAHTVFGIGLNAFDIDRLELEIGEEILPGICIQEDEGITGAFRIICDGLHEDDLFMEEESDLPIVEAIGAEA